MAYIGRQNLGGAYRQLDDISSSFNGSTTAFTMQVNSTNVSLGDVNQIVLSLGGVIQKPGTDFTISGSTLTFTTAPATNTSFFAILLGSDNGGTVTPTDGSVTSSKLAYPFVVNEDGADNDFRVESNSNANALHVDGGNSSVGINTTGASDATLEIHDSVSLIKMQDTDDNTFSRMYHSAGNFLIDVDKGDTGSNSYFQVGIDDEQVMKITADGEMTKAKQPAFLVQPTSVQTNFNQGQSVTVVFGTEIFDVGANFASNTFTAPVTGRYRFDVSVRVNELSTQDSSTYYYWALGTSNRVYYHLSSVNELGSGGASFTLAGSVLADMDAHDTASITIIMGGTSGSGPSDISNDTYWSGNLVC